MLTLSEVNGASTIREMKEKTVKMIEETPGRYRKKSVMKRVSR